MTARPLLILALGAALVAVAAVACGGSNDGGAEQPEGTGLTGLGAGSSPEGGPGILVSGTGPREIDVCTLLTPAEASGLAGEELRDPSVERYGNGQSVCTFGATRFMSYTFVQVSLFVESPEMSSGGFSAREVFADQREANRPVEEIDGIGDDAYRHANTLEVLAGPVTFGVRIAMADPGGMVKVPQEDLEEMARIVLGRLSENQG